MCGSGVEVGEVHQADGAAADLVFIGRSNAAARGADRGRRIGGFAVRVELAVQRQDQGDVLGHAQIFRGDSDALRAQLGDLVEEGRGIEHHAVADHRQLVFAQHARGQQRELVGLAVDHQRVAGVMAALETDDDVRLLRQPVDDLALPFVAPLGADDDNIGHSRVIPIQSVSRRHDPRGKPVPTFPGSCLRQALSAAQGRSHARQPTG
ncbi:GNAT superfamily N-acetyltransferase [Bradyrhizobium diazoefficiens]